MSAIGRPVASLVFGYFLFGGIVGTCQDLPSMPVVPHATTTAVSTMTVALSQADIAVARAAVVPNLFKGGFGEAHLQRYLTHYLRDTGNWQPLTARLGTQGIDGLHVKIDAWGTIRDLIVSEAKFGTSSLGVTSDGLQMGGRWISSRLTKVGGIYNQLADSIHSGGLTVAPVRIGRASQRIQIPLWDGKAAVFWREGASAQWKFAGPQSRLNEAAEQCRSIGNYLGAAGDSRISYRSYIYRIHLRDSALHVCVKDARNLDVLGNEAKLPVARQLTIPLDKSELYAIQRMSQREVAELLRKKFPAMSKADIESYSSDVTRIGSRLNSLFAGERPSVGRAVTGASLKSAAVAVAIAPALAAWEDYSLRGKVAWDRVGRTAGVSFTSAGIGTAAGQSTVIYVVRNPVLQQFASRTASMLNVGSSSLVNSMGAFSGGSVASILFAYGGYFAGLHDMTTANRFAVAGVAGAAASSAVYVGTLSAVATFGTASTGSAISTLGGAAATNASLAWLGGGSVATGGGGMAVGSVILTGGTVVVVVAVPIVVMYGFHLHDRHQETVRIGLTIDYLKGKKDFRYNAKLHEIYGPVTLAVP